MQDYKTIDDALNGENKLVVPEIQTKLPEEIKNEVKESKHYNPFYSPIMNLSLAALLLLTTCVAVPKARADDCGGLGRGYGIVLVGDQRIDLSDYCKLEVEGTEGIKVYRSKIRKQPNNWDNIVNRDKVKKWIDYAHIWDTVIMTSDVGMVLDKLETESLTGKKSVKIYEGKSFLDSYLRFSPNPNKVYIPPNSLIMFEDEVYLTGDKNKLIRLKYYGINDRNQPVEFSFEMQIN